MAVQEEVVQPAIEAIGNRSDDAANHAALRPLQAAVAGRREDLSGLAAEAVNLLSAASVRQLQDVSKSYQREGGNHCLGEGVGRDVAAVVGAPPPRLPMRGG